MVGVAEEESTFLSSCKWAAGNLRQLVSCGWPRSSAGHPSPCARTAGTVSRLGLCWHTGIALYSLQSCSGIPLVFRV